MLRPVDLRNRGLRLTRLGDGLICISIEAPVGSSAVDKLSVLTATEREVVELAAAGFSNRRIADLRGASLRTIANQLSSAYKKLGITSRRELASWLSRADVSYTGDRLDRS